MKNRLTKYRFGGEGYWNEIKYDALGRVRERLSADETPITKKFYSDGRQLIQQLEDGNNAEFDYLRGPTGLDRQWNEATDKRYFYIKDPLGTVWAMIESGFTPQQSPLIRLYNYNAWGEHIDAYDINFPDYDDDPNLMRYIGCRVEAFGKGTTTQRDAIYHFGYRHYLPILQLFLQREPSNSRIQDLYNYCYNDPCNRKDECGLAWVWLIGMIIVGGLAFLAGCSARRRRTAPEECDPQDCFSDVKSKTYNCYNQENKPATIGDFCCGNALCLGFTIAFPPCMWEGQESSCINLICGPEGSLFRTEFCKLVNSGWPTDTYGDIIDIHLKIGGPLSRFLGGGRGPYEGPTTCREACEDIAVSRGYQPGTQKTACLLYCEEFCDSLPNPTPGDAAAFMRCCPLPSSYSNINHCLRGLGYY